VATTYALYKGLEINVKHSIIKHKHITHTLTDHSPANHATVQHLNLAFETHLLKLNCNVHPLDSLALVARKTLEIDRDGKAVGTISHGWSDREPYCPLQKIY
jgi:hypothetical protein